MYRQTIAFALSMCLFAGCGGQAPTPAAPAKPAAPATAEAPTTATAEEAAMPYPPMRKFAPVTLGPYEIQPKFEEEIENGHYNFFVTSGGAVKAIRAWVGGEDPTGVMVVKTEIENDYNHGHLEVPKPLPADAMLWIEAESPGGETFKGSTPLVMVP